MAKRTWYNYQVILTPSPKDQDKFPRNYAYTVSATTAGQASRIAKKETRTSHPKWRVLSVKRIGLAAVQNGIDRLKRNPDRLQDAVIVVRGKRVKGKAKYDSKQRRVRVFVPQVVARKLNPEAVTVKSVLSSRYGTTPLESPPIAILWSAERVAEVIGYPKALLELSTINRSRQRAGKMPAYPAEGTKLYQAWLSSGKSKGRRKR